MKWFKLNNKIYVWLIKKNWLIKILKINKLNLNNDGLFCFSQNKIEINKIVNYSTIRPYDLL